MSKISLSILKLSQYTMLNVVLRHLPSENERNFFRFGVFLIFFPSPTSALDSSSLLVDIIRTKLRRMPIRKLITRFALFLTATNGNQFRWLTAKRFWDYPTLCISQIIHFLFNEIADGNILLLGS